MQTLIDNIHDQFVRDVATGRKRGTEEIRALADGRLFTGEQAKDLGLIDRFGNFQDALDRAAELSGIRGKPVILYPEEKRPRILEFLLQGFAGSLFRILQGFPVPP